ncbi:MAG: VCBS repeat-containing protein, partial [Bacteroidia bacterium]|nr:VCBS repeat-containing protein [Bacteroidia bacterium]
MNKLIPIFIAVVFFFFSCSQEDKPVSTNSSEVQLLQSLSSSETGLNFNNRIIETETTNAITFDGMLQGAGVAVLDVNKDGLQDIYFASNMEGDKLYLNKGDFSFEDITSKAGISPANWTTGVAVVDINNDGYDDIYVCKFLYDEAQKRQNVFYINNGDGTFTNQASQMGLADIGYS